MEGTFLKNHLRKEIRLRRQALDHAARQSMDEAINHALLALVENAGIESLSAFLAFDGEPDLGPALELLRQRGLRVVLPVITGQAASSMLQFRDWKPASPLVKGRFGIAEPATGDVVSPKDLDLVLLPLVAWDPSGGRLGMGAGYYDRALAGTSDDPHPLRIGVAYELQKVERLPSDPWDVRLHQVITEKGRFTCST